MLRPSAWMRAGLCAAVGLSLATPARAVMITEFPAEAGAPVGKHAPWWIASAPDGTIWYTSDGTTKSIRHNTTAGEPLTPINQGTVQVVDLAFAADGTMWWTRNTAGGGGGTGHRDPSGFGGSGSSGGYVTYAIGFNSQGQMRWTQQTTSNGLGAVCRSQPDSACKQPGGFPASRFTDLVLDADGRLWTVAFEANRMARLTVDEQSFDRIVEFPGNGGPARAALGTDGNLWVTAYNADRIYSMTPNGDISKFFQLPPGTGPNAIALGPDGALWFTGYASNLIGRLTTDLQYTPYPVPTADAGPYSLITGADGNIWFTEYKAGNVARLVPDAGGQGGGGGGGGGGGVSGADTFAPRFLRGLAFSPARFRRSSRSLAVNTVTRRRATPIGSQMRFTLSEAATVTIAIDRPATGRRVGRACLAPTRARRSNPRCTRYLRARTLTRKALQGPNQIAFTGRFGGRNLALGSYRATATAVDTARNRSLPSVARFTLVAR